MILTVTMNPSVDIGYQINPFSLDQTNRVTSEQVSKTAGGKGLNVARVIHQMDGKVLATGIVGGTIGDFIQKQLAESGIHYDFYQINQESRNCIAILHENQQTEILEAGPTVNEIEINGFLAHYQKLLPQISVVTMSGSLLSGAPIDLYAKMITLANDMGKKVLLDTSGMSLKAALLADNKPELIKPNQHELAELAQQSVEGIANIKQILSDQLFEGIKYVVVSLGAEGALIKYQQNFYQAHIPKIKVINPVGSGDATIAGLAIGIANEQSFEDLIKTGMTTGMLNTMEKQTGFVDKDQFANYFDQVIVEKI